MTQSDPAVLRKINKLPRDVMRQPFRGLGKPESLKGNLYRVTGSGDGQRIEVIQCRYHYRGRRLPPTAGTAP